MKIVKINTGERIDKFLSKEFFSYSRKEISDLIKKERVLINGETVKPSYVLKKGDKVEIKFSETKKESKKLYQNKDIEIEVIYSDKNIIVVNKKPGISVHPNSKEKKKTLVNGLVSIFPEIVGVGDDSGDLQIRPGIVHRLDKDTSGLMVIARSQKAFDKLKEAFREGKVFKKYLVLVNGKIKDKKITIESPIARAGNYKKQVIAGRKTKTKVREAKTDFRVLKEFGNYSLIEAIPKTGRMHQIRIHLFSIGNPVIGDRLYFRKGKKGLWASRQMLHASEISFKIIGKSYSFKSDPPEDFEEFLGGSVD